MKSDFVRVRYAPSPTGYLHIGNARTALFNYLFARKHGGDFVIRVEDTDYKRNIAQGELSQLEYLKWLGIDWDESIDTGGPYGPYRQSERLDLYRTWSQVLIENKKAYYCYCTEAELADERTKQMARGANPKYSGKCRHLSEAERLGLETAGRKPSVRYLVSEDSTYNFHDLIKGEITVSSEDIGDWIIIKKDGVATYNFAVVIDDHFMEITHVLRGDDHLINTPKQLMIYNEFAWTPPKFGHMTLIVNKERKKLSKRDNDIVQFIEQYKEKGYVAEALFNFIALLGWHPGGEEEILSKEEFIKQFSMERMSKSPAFFDEKKLLWLNQQYIKKMSQSELKDFVLPHLIKAGLIKNDIVLNNKSEWLDKLLCLYKDYLRYGEEIVTLSKIFFSEHITYEEDHKVILEQEGVQSIIKAYVAEVALIEIWEEQFIKEIFTRVKAITGKKGKELFIPLRLTLFGQMHGPDLAKSIALLEKEQVVARLKSVIKER